MKISEDQFRALIREQAKQARHAHDTTPLDMKALGVRVFLDEAMVREYVADHGRLFLGIERPKGFRKRKDKLCFVNAFSAAAQGRGTYVEGFGASINGVIIHHAWITIDGVHAIDQTWHDPETCCYFGVSFSGAEIGRVIHANGGYAGVLDPKYFDLRDPRDRHVDAA